MRKLHNEGVVHLDEGGRSRGQARLIEPAPSLSPWIEHYSVEHNDNGRRHPVWRVVPDCSTHLIFTMGSAPGRAETAKCCLVGARRRFYDVSLEGRCLTVAARLRPGALNVLAQSRADLFTDRAIAIDDVFGSAGRSLVERIGNHPETAVAHIEAFLQRPFARSSAARRLEQAAHAAASVAALAQQLGLSLRSAYTHIVDATGLTPKRMLRILRLHGALRHMNGGRGWAEIAYRCGFSDQAHLVREFTSLLGEPPNAWRNRGRADFFKTARPPR